MDIAGADSRVILYSQKAVAVALHLRQGLASNLHFRQWEVPKYSQVRQFEARNRGIFVYLRQVIGSNRGK